VVTDEVVVLAAPVDDVRGVRPVDVGAVGAAAVVCRGAVGVDVAVDVAAALVVGERVVSGAGAATGVGPDETARGATATATRFACLCFRRWRTAGTIHRLARLLVCAPARLGWTVSAPEPIAAPITAPASAMPSTPHRRNANPSLAPRRRTAAAPEARSRMTEPGEVGSLPPASCDRRSLSCPALR